MFAPARFAKFESQCFAASGYHAHSLSYYSEVVITRMVGTAKSSGIDPHYRGSNWKCNVAGQ
jgi:hypothetical protein